MKKRYRWILILLAAMLMVQMAGCKRAPAAVGDNQMHTTPWEPTDPTGSTDSTAPADGDPDNVSCKGSYSVSNADFSAAVDQVVATLGTAELTNGQLQVYYQMVAAAYTGDDAPDLDQPLEVQLCDKGSSARTWQQYFLEQALKMWQSRQVLALNADVDSFDDAQKAFLEQIPQLVEEDANLAEYTRVMNVAYIHFANQYDSLQAPAEETEQEPVEGEPRAVDIRYIRLAPDSMELETIIDTFEQAYGQEDDFALLAGQYSLDEGSRRNGGLYAGLRQGWLIAELDAWAFDPERCVGDYTVIESSDAILVLKKLLKPLPIEPPDLISPQFRLNVDADSFPVVQERCLL